jgi:hypothetical protein
VQESGRGLYSDLIDRILRCWFSIQSKVAAAAGGVANGDAGSSSNVDVGQGCDADISSTTDGEIGVGASSRGTRPKAATVPVRVESDDTCRALGPQRATLPVEGSTDLGTMACPEAAISTGG